MENHHIDKIILAFLKGDASAGEVITLREWLKEEEHAKVFESLKAFWEDATIEVRSQDTEQAYDKLMKNINNEGRGIIVDINTPQRPGIFIKWLRIAAAVIILFTSAALLYYFRPAAVKPVQTAQYNQIIKENPKGQKLTTFLPDGSKVILNSLSRIKYSSPFEGADRIIELEGEAFFEVKKDPEKPFMVRTNGITTTALGTSFNVKYRSDDLVKVSLVSGKVKVEKNKSKKFVILNPGKSAIVKNNEGIIVSDFDYLSNIGWKDGILIFKNNSFKEITDKVENWYGVKIIGTENIPDKSDYTGMYKNEMLSEVLEGLSFVYGFDFEINMDTVKISLKP